MAEDPAASSRQEQMGEGDRWAAQREAERRRRQDVAARPAAATPQREVAEPSASQNAEVLEALVAAEPAAAEAAAEPQAAAEAAVPEPMELQTAAEPAELQAAAEPSAAVAVKDPAGREPAQPAAVLSQQGRKQVAAGRSAAGSPEPCKLELSKHQLRKQKEAASRKNRAESKKHRKETCRSGGPCGAPDTVAQLDAAAEAATKEGELVRGQSVTAEPPVEQAACVAAPVMEAAEPATGAVQAAAPAVGSALLPQDLPATGQPVAHEAAGVCADPAPAAASNSLEPAALVPAAASKLRVKCQLASCRRPAMQPWPGPERQGGTQAGREQMMRSQT